jgi:hypothetical protein
LIDSITAPPEVAGDVDIKVTVVVGSPKKDYHSYIIYADTVHILIIQLPARAVLKQCS